jgi:hypothetical protein
MATPMHFVNSSQISYVGYDKETKELFIKFKNNSVYRYARVPQDEYNNLLKAESVGKYFTEHIKNEYEGIKI